MENTMTTFLAKIKPSALAIEAETGIPWIFAAVQSAHESRWGLSRLTLEANNLFGVTGDSWAQEGKPVYWIVTKEFSKDGTSSEIRRPFRKYADWAESLRDWAGLIQRRYPRALAGARAGNFPEFAQGLQEGGYATDPKYALQLVALHSELEGIA